MRTIGLTASIMAAALALTPAQAGDKGGLTVAPVATDADAANGGVIYALPRTVVRIELTARVVVASVGPFFQYSTRFLNRTDVVTENATSWKLTGAKVSTTGQADPARRFKVTAAQGSELPSLTLAADGTLLGINTSPSSDATPEATPATPNTAYATFAEVPLSQSILSRTSKAAMAEECAQTIYSLRDSRTKIICGAREAVLPDAGSMKTALAEIDRLERLHTELFVGRRDTLIVTKVVEVTPDYDGTNNMVPVRFSESSGFVDAMDLSGKPVYVDLEFDDRGRVNAYAPDSKMRKEAPMTGLFYTLPGSVIVKVSDRNIVLCQKKVSCTQNGQLANLPAEQLTNHQITLDAATGALSSLRLIDKK